MAYLSEAIKKLLSPTFLLKCGFFALFIGFFLFGGMGTFGRPGIQKAQAAITYQTPGTIGYSAANGASVAPSYPASIAKGNLLVLIVGMKPSSANSGSVTTPTNWTAITSLTGAGGYGATLGADTGNTNVWAYYRVADGTESGSLTVTISTNNVAWGKIFRMSNATGGWSVAGTTGSDTSAGSVSITMSADPGVTSGDYILGGMVIPTDVTTPSQFSAEALTQTGITFGTVTEVEEPDSTTGNDIGGFLIQAPVSSGTSSAAPTMTATAGGTTTNVRGPGIFVRAREVAATTIADGTNPGNSTIAPGGSITSVDVFTLTTSSGTDGITAVTVNLSTNSGVGTLTITDGSDASLGSIGGGTGSGISSGSNTISISSTNATTGGTTFKVKVTPLSHANMPVVPGASYSITATVTDWTGTNAKVPYLVTGDTSSTVTIDNTSPNAATSTSGSAGNAAVTLGWTTASGETTDSVVLRWAASSPGAEVPVEGTSYSVGNTITTATVACVFTSQTTATVLSGKIDGTSGSSGCNTSALTNGQAYSYKIFEKDSNGNYDTGTTITGGPFTPAVPSMTIGGTATTTGTVAVAFNGSVQGQTTTISGGTWTITGLTPAATNDVITVWVDGAAEAAEATGVTKYDGTGNITGMVLNTNVLSLGSGDNPSLTFANLGLYDSDNDEDISHIANGSTFSVGAGYSDPTLSILSGATFTMGSSDTLLTDNVSIAGTLTSTTNSAYSITGNWTDTGTFTPATSTVTMSGNSTGRTITTTGSTFYNLSIDSSFNSTSVTLQDSTTVSNVLTVALTDTFNAGTGTTLTLSGAGGTPLSVSGTFSGGTSTVSFTGVATTTIPALTYYNLSLAPASGNPTYNFSTGTTTTNNLTIGSGTTMTANANPASITLDVNGDVTISNNATFGFPGSGKTFTVGGSWSNLGTYTANSGTVTFDATTSGKTITNLGAGNAWNLVVFNGVGGVWAVTGGNMITAGLTITNGSLSSVATFYTQGNLVVNGAITGGSIILRNNGTLSGSGSVSVTDFNVGDSGDGAQTMGATGSMTVTISGVFNFNANQTFNAGGLTYVLSGSGTPLVMASGSILNPETSTISYTRTSGTVVVTADTATTALTYYNLDFSPASGTPTFTMGSAASQTITVNNNFTLNGAGNETVNLATNDPAFTVSGNVTIGSGDTLTASDAADMTVAGSWTNSGTFTHNSRTVNFTAGATGKTITSNGANGKFYNATFNNASGGWTLQDATEITNVLTITAGNFSAGSVTLTLSGTSTPLSVGGTFTPATSTVSYTNTTSANITRTTYYNLDFSPASGTPTYTLLGGGTLTVSNNLTLNGAGNETVNATTNDPNIDVNGSVTIGSGDTFIASNSGTFTVAVNWTNSGTFTHSNGTVTFDTTATAVLNGATTFYNFTATTGDKTLNFTAGQTFTTAAGGVLTITGTSGHNVIIGSTSASQWFINHQGTESVSYVTLSYSGCDGASTTITITNATDNGNNGICWSGFTTVITISGTANGNNGATVKVAVSGSLQGQSTTISGGTWTISGVAGPSSGNVVTVWIDGVADANESTAITKYDGTGNITGMVLNTNVLSLGSVDNPTFNVSTDFSGYDASADEDVMFDFFTQLTPKVNFIEVVGGTNTYTDPTISILSGATLNLDTSGLYAGGMSTDNLTNAGTFASIGFAIINVNGNWTNSATFTPDSSTVTFTATDTGHTINNGSSDFANVIFNGSGGAWSPLTNTLSANTITMTAGTLNNAAGSANVSVYGGDVTGDGIINMTAGTFTVFNDSNSGFGSATPWTFYNLNFGTGETANTTTTGGGTVTVTNVLTLASSHTLDNQSLNFTLSGSGTPFVRSGSLTNDSTTSFTYSSSSGVTALASAAMTGANAFPNLIINGTGTFTAGVAVEAVSSVTVSGGTLAMGANNLTAGNSSYANSGSIKVANGQSLTQSSGGTTTIKTSASGANCIGSSGSNCSGTQGTITFGGLTIGDGATTMTTTLGATSPTVAVAGTFNITTNATLAAGSSILTLSGTGTPITRSGTFTAGTSTVTYTSGSGITALSNAVMTGGNSFYGLTINGTGTFTAGINFNVTGDLTVSGGTFAGTPDVTVNGVVSGSGTINFTGGTFTHSSTTSKNFGGNTAWTFYNLTVGGSSGTTAASGSGGITVTQALTISSGHALDAGAKTWTLSQTGTPFTNSGAFTASTSVFQYTGGHGTTVTPDTYYDLTIAPTGNGSAYVMNNGTLTVNHDLVFGNGVNTSTALNLNGGNIPITVGRNFTINASMSVTAATTGNISVGGNWTNSGTFNANSKTVTFTATSGTKTIDNNASSFYNVVINGSGGTFQTSGHTLTISNTLTVTAGTLSGTQDVTVNGANATGDGTINLTGGTFTLFGTGNFGGATAWTFSSLSFTGTATTTATGAGGITTSGVLTIGTGHILDAASKTWTLSGSGTPLVRTGTLTANTSTFTYTSGSGVAALSSAAMTGSNAFYGLIINGTGTFTAGVAITAKNNLTVTSGTLAMGASDIIIGDSLNNDSGNVKVASGQFLTQTSSGTTTIFGYEGGTNCIGSTGTNCVGTPGTITFGNLTLGNGANQFATTLGGTTPTITVAGLLDITGDATLSGGAGSTINLTGNGTVFTNSGTFTAGTSTIAFNSASTTGTTVPALTYYNLTLNKASNTFTGTNSTVVQNDFTITAGTFTAPAGNFTVGGNFTNTGTFTHNNGTVILDTVATSTVGGTSTSFYNFTSTVPSKTIQFTNGNTFTFNGTLTLNGGAGTPINAYSNSNGMQWTFYLLGTAAVNYTNVKDAACHGSSASVATSITINNAGNNGTCWGFVNYGTSGGSTYTEGGSSGSSGNDNQSGGGAGATCGTASGTVTITGDAVTGIVVIAGGGCYTATPVATICNGGGSGAQLTAVLTNGVVTSVTVNAGGSGYTNPTMVFGASPEGTGGGCPQGGGGGGGGGGGSP